MGANASRKKSSGAATGQSGGATAEQPLPSGDQTGQSDGATAEQPLPSGDQTGQSGGATAEQPLPSGDQTGQSDGATAVQPLTSGDQTGQSGGATAEQPLPSGDQTGQSGGATSVKPLPSGDQGKLNNPEAMSSPQAVEPNTVVENNTTAVLTAKENNGDAVEAGKGEKALGDTEESQWLGFREIFVQYIPGKPYALTEFGASLYSHDDRHEFRAIDGTGLAKAAGLRDGDVLLGINNLQVGLQNAQQLAILECFSDIGTSFGLVVGRKSTETWLIAFHLNEKGNRPVVENLFIQRIDSENSTGFPYFIGDIPVESAFEVNPVYEYEDSAQVQIILQNGDRFMEIDTDKATYVIPTQTLTLNRYRRIDSGSTDGIPVAISSPSTSDSPMCIEAVGSGPLGVVVFPPYMTQPGSIPQNNMFFLVSFTGDGSAVMKAANTQQELYIASDIQSSMLWIATLGTPPSTFKVEYGNRILKTLQDFLEIFDAQES